MGHECNNEKLFDVLTEGQNVMFEKLDTISSTLQAVAVQHNEIQHLRKDVDILRTSSDEIDARVTHMEQQLLPQKPHMSKKVCEAVVIAVSISAAVAIFWLFSFIAMNHIKGFIKFRQGALYHIEYVKRVLNV